VTLGEAMGIMAGVLPSQAVIPVLAAFTANTVSG
jgi:hypothetical protein